MSILRKLSVAIGEQKRERGGPGVEPRAVVIEQRHHDEVLRRGARAIDRGERDHHPPRLDRADFVSLRPGQGVQEVEELPDIRADKDFAQAPIPARFDSVTRP